MKRLIVLMVMLVMAGMVFAGAISEQSIRDDYEKKGGFPNRDAWLYEFNSIAAKVIEGSNKILNPGPYDISGMSGIYKENFDNDCVRYKVLLDIGVEKKYITDAVRKQQMEKAEVERKKVAQYLASKSSGLGLE